MPRPRRALGPALARRGPPEWIRHADNPRTGPVLVNGVWHRDFEQGLVRSPSDFGYNGDQPSYPELVDRLLAQTASLDSHSPSCT